MRSVAARVCVKRQFYISRKIGKVGSRIVERQMLQCFRREDWIRAGIAIVSVCPSRMASIWLNRVKLAPQAIKCCLTFDQHHSRIGSSSKLPGQRAVAHVATEWGKIRLAWRHQNDLHRCQTRGPRTRGEPSKINSPETPDRPSMWTSRNTFAGMYPELGWSG